MILVVFLCQAQFKTRNPTALVMINSYLKDGAFTAVKRDEAF